MKHKLTWPPRAVAVSLRPINAAQFDQRSQAVLYLLYDVKNACVFVYKYMGVCVRCREGKTERLFVRNET